MAPKHLLILLLVGALVILSAPCSFADYPFDHKPSHGYLLVEELEVDYLPPRKKPPIRNLLQDKETGGDDIESDLKVISTHHTVTS